MWVCDYTIYRVVLVGIVQKDMSLRIGWKGLESGDPSWIRQRGAGTIISRRLSPFSFRVASMLSRGGKSLRKDHCAPTRSHDRRIATHRRRVPCVIGVTGTVEIFIGSSLLLRYVSVLQYYIGPLSFLLIRRGGLNIEVWVNARISARDVRLRASWLPTEQTATMTRTMYNTLFSRVERLDMRSCEPLLIIMLRVPSYHADHRSYRFASILSFDRNTRRNSRVR